MCENKGIFCYFVLLYIYVVIMRDWILKLDDVYIGFIWWLLDVFYRWGVGVVRSLVNMLGVFFFYGL